MTLCDICSDTYLIPINGCDNSLDVIRKWYPLPTKKKLQTYIDSDLFKKLEQMAKREGTSVSQQAARILEFQLEHQVHGYRLSDKVRELDFRVQKLEASSSSSVNEAHRHQQAKSASKSSRGHKGFKWTPYT